MWQKLKSNIEGMSFLLIYCDSLSHGRCNWAEITVYLNIDPDIARFPSLAFDEITPPPTRSVAIDQ